MTNQTTVVYGPAGCGKTSIAKDLARALGLSRILDEMSKVGCVEDGRFKRREFVHVAEVGALVLTDSEAVARSFPGARVLSFAEAVELLQA